MDGQERAVIGDVDGLNDSQAEAIGAIERLAAGADLSLDTVAAVLSLQNMQREKEVPATPEKRRDRA